MLSKYSPGHGDDLSDNRRDELETPLILKSNKPQKVSEINDHFRMPSKSNELQKPPQQFEDSATRFFDPEFLSSEPIKYPNITYTQGMNGPTQNTPEKYGANMANQQSSASFGPPIDIQNQQKLNPNSMMNQNSNPKI